MDEGAVTESSSLIAETLRLDGEATKGPWRQGRLASYDAITGEPERFVYRGDGESGTTRLCIRGGEGEDGAVFDCDADASAIVAYRTSAPRLARMLQVAIDALTEIDDRFSRETLTEIERIAKEETK